MELIEHVYNVHEYSGCKQTYTGGVGFHKFVYIYAYLLYSHCICKNSISFAANYSRMCSYVAKCFLPNEKSMLFFLDITACTYKINIQVAMHVYILAS